ncbi:hypothetical protein B0H13DRAFT_1597794 [Mycena leptocephala]|nr:hypothetical protein B0H13DRAFT_1597794 [Mycena leptocephala]
MQKLCFLTGLLYCNAGALGIFLGPLPGVLLICARTDLVQYYNWAFTLPSLINTVVVFPLCTHSRYLTSPLNLKYLRRYAHLMTLKDNFFGTFAVCVPAGDTAAKRRSGGNATKYRNMRILCFFWVYSTTAAVIAGAGFQISRGFRWYNFVPMLIFHAYTVFRTHPFIFFR